MCNINNTLVQMKSAIFQNQALKHVAVTKQELAEWIESIEVIHRTHNKVAKQNREAAKSVF